LPPEQTCPAAHFVPHVPQFRLSLPVLTHFPPQVVCPVPQVTAQTPPAQLCPAGQTRPQAPQWLLEVRRSWQLDPQRVSPCAHVQRPAAHDEPAAHTTPH
jgi:hypothetical protein